MSSKYFVLTSRSFKPLLLHPGEECVIGRSKQNRVCLRLKTLSRNHSKITITSEAEAFLEDLESRNGTFLNGTRLGTNKVRLRSGDRIQVGEAQILFEEQSEEEEESLDHTSTATVNWNKKPSSSSEMMGNLSHMSLIEVFTTLNYFEKTGRLQLRQGDQFGEIDFFTGEVVAARFGKIENLKAIYEVLSLKEGLFEFKPDDRISARPALLTMQQIMMNHAHQLDQKEHPEEFAQTDIYPIIQSEEIDNEKKAREENNS